MYRLMSVSPSGFVFLAEIAPALALMGVASLEGVHSNVMTRDGPSKNGTTREAAWRTRDGNEEASTNTFYI